MGRWTVTQLRNIDSPTGKNNSNLRRKGIEREPKIRKLNSKNEVGSINRTNAA